MPPILPKVAFPASLCSAVFLTLLASAPVLAATPAESAAAREHYQKGSALYDLGKYPEAIKEFETAYEIKEDPAFLFNLAQSHRLAGNNEQALRFYKLYLRRVPDPPNRTVIEAHITALEQAIAGRNSSQTTPPGMTAPPVTTVPQATAPPPPSTAPLEPPVAAPPAASAIPTTPVPPPPAGPPAGPGATAVASPAAPSPAPGHTLRVAGTWTAIGGGVLVLVGAAEGSRAVAAANEINNAAKAGKAFDPAVEARGKSAVHAEAGLLSVGFLALAAGAGLYYWSYHSGRAASEHQVSVAPVASARETGVLMQVTF
jgi:tetratricopeptide (TPR) repeat protein